MSDDVTAWARRAWGHLEPIHAIGYFAPETTRAYVDLGLHERLSYFAARSAAFGPVGPAVPTATFFVFAPWLHDKALPASWQIASPAQVQTARRDGVAQALDRLLGSPDVGEALDIARRACAALRPHGRPLYAAHASLDWPDEPLLALWHAATLIREHRGDGHVGVLVEAGLDPVEALVLGGAYTDSTTFVRRTRGWSDEQWHAALADLAARGFVGPDGDLTEQGRAYRSDLEDRTDELAREGWEAVGPRDTARLVELLAPLRAQLLDGDALPGWFSSRGD